MDLCESSAEIGELLIDGLAPDEIVVEVAETTLRSTPADAAGAIVNARLSLYSQTGLQIPHVHVVPIDAPPGAMSIRLNNVRLPESRSVGGTSWREVVDTLHGALTTHASWFLRMRDVETSRSQLAHVPHLVRLSASAYPSPLLTACLRSLLLNGDSVRNLPRILWLLLEAGGCGTDPDMVRLSETPLLSFPEMHPVDQRAPELLASGLRKRIADEAWRVGAANSKRTVVSLPIEVENTLICPDDAGALADAEWRAVEAVRSIEAPFHVVTHSTLALEPIRYALLALPVPPRVIASQELPPDAALPPIVDG